MTAKTVIARVVLTVRVFILAERRRNPLNPKPDTYDSCFYIGKYAKELCPGRNLGPTPVGRECPTYLYPYPFNTNN